MCIVVGQCSDTVPTVKFGNVEVGPVAIMRPVPNHADLDLLAMEARTVELLAQYVVGTERRMLQWALNPTTKIERPTELVAESTGMTFGEFVEKKISATPKSEAGAETPVAAEPAPAS